MRRRFPRCEVTKVKLVHKKKSPHNGGMTVSRDLFLLAIGVVFAIFSLKRSR